MTEERSRKEFEAFVLSTGRAKHHIERFPEGDYIYGDVRFALEAWQEARRQEWQPIETAPKDGTRVLLLCGDEFEVGYWSTSIWVTRPEGAPLGKQDGAWIIYENRSDTIELNPTHWMPLPPKP